MKETHIMIISKDQLYKIQDLVKYYYNQGTSSSDIPGECLVSLAWTQAVMSVLQPEVKLEITQRNSTDSVFDE